MKNLLEIFKEAAKDVVDVLMLLLMLVIAIVDFFTDVPTGGYLFFFVYVFFAVARIGYWKLKAKGLK